MSEWEEREEEYQADPAPPDYATVASRCAARGLALGRIAMIQAGKLAIRSHGKRFGVYPPRAPEIVKVAEKGSADLVAATYVYAYSEEALPLLDEALDAAKRRYGD